MKRSAAPGPDGVTVKMLFHARHALAMPLATLFNQILQENKVPLLFKKAKISLLHKKNSRDEPKNYRPLSMTSNVGKLFEHIMNKVLLDYLEKIGYLSSRQHGFRRKRGTQTALVQMWKKFNDIYASKGGLHFFGLDLSKAFDLCNHGKLVEVLYDAGIRGNFGATLVDWLLHRTQYVEDANQLNAM